MKDRYGFEIEPNDFIIVSDRGQEFLEYRVHSVRDKHIIADRCGNNMLIRQFIPLWRPFMKVTSPAVEERLKEKFWKVEGNKPWEIDG